MLRMLTVIPPIQRSMMAGSDVAFWVMIGLLVVLALVATALWIVGNRRIAQKSPQIKDDGYRYETLPPTQEGGSERLPAHPRHEEEILIRR
jgi:hypothetical protein